MYKHTRPMVDYHGRLLGRIGRERRLAAQAMMELHAEQRTQAIEDDDLLDVIEDDQDDADEIVSIGTFGGERGGSGRWDERKRPNRRYGRRISRNWKDQSRNRHCFGSDRGDNRKHVWLVHGTTRKVREESFVTEIIEDIRCRSIKEQQYLDSIGCSDQNFLDVPSAAK